MRTVRRIIVRAFGGPAPAIRPEQLISQCIRLGAGSVFSYTADAAELQHRAGAVIEGIRAGWLRVDEGKAYPLESATQAHRDIESLDTQGKLYLGT
jgi:NADPH2:quinone reductase